MEKIREEVLVEIYIKHRGEIYVRGMEYTVGEDDDSIEWHLVDDEGKWSFVKDMELYKELEKTYIAKFVNG